MSHLVLDELAFEPPKDTPTFTIKTNRGDLILRQPLAYDFRCLDSAVSNATDNRYDRFFIVADHLGISINGKPVTMNDLALLDSASFTKLINWVAEIYASIMPELSPELMAKLGILE